MKKRYVLIAIVSIAILITCMAYALIYNTPHIDNTATIVGTGELGVYEDIGCTTELTDIDWGEFNNTLGTHDKNKTLYLKNLGTANIYVRYYSLSFSGWDDRINTKAYYKYCISTPTENGWLLMLFRAMDDSRITSMNGTTPTVIELGYNEVIELYFTLVAIEYALPEDNIAFTTYFEASDS